MMKRVFLCVLVGIVLGFYACGGGGGGTTPTTEGTSTAQIPFSVVLSADPEQGPAPLTVSFSAYAFGGFAPYTFKWDFNGDSIFDSTETNPFYTFTSSSVVTLSVTDAKGRAVQATKSIIITTGGESPFVEPLRVTFTASVTSGVAPLLVTFEAIVSGGTPPYRYQWDFDGDGITDSFSQKVVWTYDSPGPPTVLPDGSTAYFFKPSLTVIDNRNIQRSTLDDANQDGQPDWPVLINVMPPSRLSPSIRANPVIGQVPLTVDFSAGASGGQPPYLFKWNFGDGFYTDWTDTSSISHTFQNQGTFYVRVTVKDSQGVVEESGAQAIIVSPKPTFEVTITAEETSGPVPFKVELKAQTKGGREPISYLWQVFTDVSRGSGDPAIVLLPLYPTPYLDNNAVVAPETSTKPAPTFIFGTYVGQTPLGADNDGYGVGAPYVVRLIATDASGVQAFSNLLRISPTAPEPPDVYLADRPPKVAQVGDTIYSARQHSAFSPRANPAVATHPSGVVFVIGGDKLSPTGEFQGIVDLLDSNWALNLSGQDIGNPGQGVGYANGGWTECAVLNNVPYPQDAMGNITVPNPDLYPPGYARPDRPILRGDRFIPRGSAAAALIHEPVDTNPAVGYVNPFEPPVPDNMFGVPVIYVFGGRDNNGNALDVVQKYYPPGFGTEDLPIDTDADLDGSPDAQVTNNQVDIWTNRFQFPDWDLWPQMGQDINPPIVPDRPPQDRGGGTGSVPLNPLPEPLYGHQAVTIESVGNIPPPVWPDSPYSYIFILGGINGDGNVVSAVRWFNTAMPPSERQEGQEPQPGDYSVITQMPVERAYHHAVVIPPNVAVNRRWQIIVFGGFDRNGNYVAQVDRFTFDSNKNPVTGSWDTVAVLPEAAAGLGAGWEYDERGYVYHQFGGYTVDGPTSSIFDILESGAYSYAPFKLIPRAWFGMGQIGYDADYYIIAGWGEGGMTSVVERYRP